MSDGGVKFTWTVSLTDRSDSQMLCERGKHDSQLAKMGGAAQDVPTQNLSPLLIPTFQFTMLFFIFTSAFLETKFYPSHRKIKKSFFKNKINDYFRYAFNGNDDLIAGVNDLVVGKMICGR